MPVADLGKLPKFSTNSKLENHRTLQPKALSSRGFANKKSPKSVVYLWIEHIVAFVTKIYRHFSLFLFLSRNSAPYPRFHFFGESTSPLSFRGEWATLTQKKKVKKCCEKNCLFWSKTRDTTETQYFSPSKRFRSLLMNLENLKVSDFQLFLERGQKFVI